MAVLVTLPETTPVNETIETAYALEDDVGIRLGPIIVNGVDQGTALPDPEATEATLDGDGAAAAVGLDDETRSMLREAARFRRSRRAMEHEALERLSTELPLAQIHVRALPVAGLDAASIDLLASELVEGAQS